ALNQHIHHHSKPARSFAVSPTGCAAVGGDRNFRSFRILRSPLPFGVHPKSETVKTGQRVK
ncbi:MAG: hypothetical protein K2X72_39520, partial [Reyranella sp.]|nr:hypothetical protein [Reyranella sp.]